MSYCSNLDKEMELDEEQEFVVSEDQSTLCISGPGSGKTRVLTEKARRVFGTGQSLLCLTFTRSAAREMASRVPGIPAATIHSYCCGLVGWKDEWKYQGLLWRTMMMKDKPKFDWILMDEVQDLNPEEMDVALSLVGGKIFAVGDPYQSIYGFQGALGPMVTVLLHKMGCRKVELHNNYRSCPSIVDKLNRIYDRKLVSRHIKQTGNAAILCRTNDDVFLVSNYLKDRGVPHTLRLSVEYADVKEREVLGESNLKVMTIHQAKGLEWDRVVLFGWYPDIDQEEEMRCYYVAVARASQEFHEVFELEEVRRLVDGRYMVA
jgi:superfamily I DNA/RNA helicase